MQTAPGGTANLTVLGGNRPPSFGTVNHRIVSAHSWRTMSGGRVARRNGPVARSTQTTTASFWLSETPKLRPSGRRPGAARGQRVAHGGAELVNGHGLGERLHEAQHEEAFRPMHAHLLVGGRLVDRPVVHDTATGTHEVEDADELGQTLLAEVHLH